MPEDFVLDVLAAYAVAVTALVAFPPDPLDGLAYELMTQGCGTVREPGTGLTQRDGQQVGWLRVSVPGRYEFAGDVTVDGHPSPVDLPRRFVFVVKRGREPLEWKTPAGVHQPVPRVYLYPVAGVA